MAGTSSRTWRRLIASLAVAALLSAPIAPTFAQVEAPVVDADAAVPAPFGVAPLTKDACPADYPVKGNKSGRQAERPTDPIYHVPGSRSYAATDPEECFVSAVDAEAAGYRAPLR